MDQESTTKKGNSRNNKTIAESFGITYSQVGDYLLPNIILKDEEICKEFYVDPIAELGKYALLHKRFLKENYPALYGLLLCSEKLYPLLCEIDTTARERLELAKKQGFPVYEAEQSIFDDLIYNSN